MDQPPDELPDLLTPHGRLRPLWVRALCLAGAFVFFFLGLAGWLILVISGIPFYLVPIVLLGLVCDRALMAINRLERRLPHRWRVELRRVLGKFPRTVRRHARLRGDAE